jgi:hypothetical protein
MEVSLSPSVNRIKIIQYEEIIFCSQKEAGKPCAKLYNIRYIKVIFYFIFTERNGSL